MLYLAHDNKLFLAPVEQPKKVLDVGTGTGVWAMYVTIPPAPGAPLVFSCGALGC